MTPSEHPSSSAPSTAHAAAARVLGVAARVRAALTPFINSPRRWVAAAGVMALGAAGGAWAVATLGPDPSELPSQRITQEVTSLVAGLTLGDIAAGQGGFSLYRTEHSRSSDTAQSLLLRLGVADLEASEFLRTNALARAQLIGRAGRIVTAEVTPEHRLLKLTARWVKDEGSGQFQRLIIERNSQELAATSAFSVRVESARLQSGTRLAGGVIHTSLFAATDAAGIPDAVATQVADIFSDINFHRLFRGDRFTLVYETLEADGEILRTGRVLAAEFRNRGQTHQAMWFQAPGEARGSYYSMDGANLRRAYLNAPVEFSRISSGFSMRIHPIHKVWKKHLGVDYAAPTGTRVRSIGDGVVDFAGWQNGFGNVVYVRHSNRSHVTVYAHLSRVDVKRGQAVQQDQTLGAVGATGWATGPHLHFEFRVDGQHRDPQTIMAEQPHSEPLAAAQRRAFGQAAALVAPQLAAAELIHQASAQ